MQFVSIIVVTYNSSKYVEETLESISSQTWPELELIITDDFSTDNTVELCREWLQHNQQRFVRTEMITVEKNTGISANCNRGLKASKGYWIHFCAGDDILLPDCIELNMKYIAENPDARVVFSQVKVYQDSFDEHNYRRTIPDTYPHNLMSTKYSAEEQYRILLLSDRITYTPSYFFNKHAIHEVGGYDERNKLVEDYPMWLRLTKAGYKLHYFHSPTAGYRIHSGATNNTGETLFKPSVINSFRVRQKYAHPYLPALLVWKEFWVYQISVLFLKMGWNKPTPVTKATYKMLTVTLNPFLYLAKLSQILQKNHA